MAPHQCEKCWFVNLCERCPDSVSLVHSQTLALLCIYNLEIFWSRDNSTIHGMLGYAKELVRRSREADRAIPLSAVTACLVGDEVRMGVAIHMLEKLLSNRRNDRSCLQFNTVRKLQMAALDIYSATAASCSSRYSLKSNCGIVLHMHEDEMNPLLV